MKTVLYARYSTDLQNPRSTDDQLQDLRGRCAREGWQIVGEFKDEAISGAAGIKADVRPGFAAMLEVVESGQADQILTEATDRLARHQRDALEIFERVTFAGARIYTLSDGEVTEITAVFKGLMDANYRKDLGAKIRRGQRGAVQRGRIPAGRAYGYEVANQLAADGSLTRGLRKIKIDEADVLLRIFREFAANTSPRSIAERLNRENVPGPSGGPWLANTLTGDRKRRNGILQNRLYRGELIHNRTSKVVDPISRKTRIRPNAESEWVIQDVPELRIIPEELWQAVQERRAQSFGTPFSRQQRPKRLLSGLGVCGICGARWIVFGKERWGCSGHRNGRGCTNSKSITTASFERRVLKGLQERMLDPDLVKAFVTEYHQEFARRTADQAARRRKLERQIDEEGRKVQRLVAAIANGAEFDEIKSALAKAQQARERSKLELSELAAVPVIALHPEIAKTYRRQVMDLTRSLTSDEQTTLQAQTIIRSLIDQVILYPRDAERGVNIDVSGRLASILALATGEQPSTAMYAAGGEGNR